MAAVDAWDFPGGDGDAVILPAGLPHLRTGAGASSKTVIAVVNFDDLNQSQRGCVWAARRTANNAINHSVCFDPTANNIEVQYGTNTVSGFETANAESVADVWLALCYCDNGNNSTRRLRRIPLSTAVQTEVAASATGGTSVFDDSQAQTFTLGATNNGSAYIQELNGQIAFFLYIDGWAMTQAECEAFAADPLNYGDELVARFGEDCYFWDDSGTDIGPNNLGTPTLVGSATRGTGNGPDVLSRFNPPIPDEPVIDSVGPLNDTVFVGEPGVQIVGDTFGPLQGSGTVYWNNVDNTDGNEEEQPGIILWSDSLLTLVDDVDIGAHTPGSLYCIVVNDDGGEASLPVTVSANPGANVGARGNFPDQSITQGVAYSLDTSDAFFLDAAVGTSLTFSLRSGALPDGVVLAPDGTLSGVIATTAVDSVAEIQAADETGAYASDEFSWTITSGSRVLRRVQDRDLTRPSSPGGFSAGNISETQNLLQWNQSTDAPTHASELVSGVAGYRLYRDGVLIADQTGRSYNDFGLSAFTNYTYTVLAYDAAGNVSTLSPGVTIRTLDQTAPSVPVITATQTGQTSISVALTTGSTDTHSGLQNYSLEHKRTVDPTFSIATGNDTLTAGDFPRSITGLVAGTQYQTRARARDNSGNLSAYSAVSSATTQSSADVTPPTAPVITASATGQSTISVALTTPSTDVGGSGVLNYRLEYKLNSVSTWTLDSDTLTAGQFPRTISGLSAGTLYDTRARARDVAGNIGNFSATSSATTTSSSSTFDADWIARSTAPGVLLAHRFENQAEVDNFLYVGNPQFLTNPDPATLVNPPIRVSTPFGAANALRTRAVGALITSSVASVPKGSTQTISVNDASRFPDPAGFSGGQYQGVFIGATDSVSANPVVFEQVTVTGRNTSANTLTVRRMFADGGVINNGITVAGIDYSSGSTNAPSIPGNTVFTIGYTNSASWNRPMCCFPATQNGLSVADRGIINGTARKTRTWPFARNGSGHANYREGYWGSKHYWDTATNPSAQYVNWTPTDGGGQRTNVYEGDEFYLQFKCKIAADRLATGMPRNKLFFLQAPSNSGAQQLFIEVGPKRYNEHPPASEKVTGSTEGEWPILATSGGDGRAPAGGGFASNQQGDGIAHGSLPWQSDYPNGNFNNRNAANCEVFGYQSEVWMTFLLHMKMGRDNAEAFHPAGTGSSNPALQPFPALSNSTYRTTLELFGALPGMSSYKTLTSMTDAIWFYGDSLGTVGDLVYNPPSVSTFWMTQEWNMYIGSGSVAPPNGIGEIQYTELIVSRNPIPVPLSSSGGSTPAYMAGLSAYQALRLNTVAGGGQTAQSVLPADWASGVPSGSGPNINVFDAWSGGTEDRVGHRMFAHGGGHGDSANNGLWIYDFDGTTAPFGYTLPSITPVSQVPTSDAAHATYGDGKPGSIHSYDLMAFDRTTDRFLRFCGPLWRSGTATNRCWSYTVASNTWTELASCPIVTTSDGSVTLDEASRKVLYLNGTTNSAFYRLDANTWSSAKTWSDPVDAGGAGFGAAYDTTRSRIVVVGVGRFSLLTVNWTAETVTQSTFSPSGQTEILSQEGIGIFYDAARDSYWMFNPRNSSLVQNIYEMNASTFAITRTTMSGDALPVNTNHVGGNHRFCFIPEWRALGLAVSFNQPAYIIKLP